ncbi:MAG TPA: AraC family transcriptional regulator [Burkholderiaceae bacterium]|nr:AraC family transcriptional regulator [Burkholderiaceae bacterium]
MGGAYRSSEPESRSIASTSLQTAGVSRIEFHSHDQDETREYLRRNYGDHSRVIHGKGKFLYRISAVAAGRVIVGRSDRWLHQTLRASVHHPTLFLSLQPGETQSYGRKRYDLQPELALFSAAGHEYTRRGGPSASLVVRVETELLEREIAARERRRSRRWLVPSTPIMMTAGRRAELLAFEAQLRAAAESGGSWGAYGDPEAFELAVAGWMADLVLDAAGVQSISEPGLERLARVQRWIDAHLDHDISLDRLCAVAGVSPRALQKTFLVARGQTPHEFVTARRLAAARRLLQGASSPVRVSTVALDCGFRHFGRFSASYRAAFGELPAETARAAQGTLRGASGDLRT